MNPQAYNSDPALAPGAAPSQGAQGVTTNFKSHQLHWSNQAFRPGDKNISLGAFAKMKTTGSNHIDISAFGYITVAQLIRAHPDKFSPEDIRKSARVLKAQSPRSRANFRSRTF